MDGARELDLESSARAALTSDTTPERWPAALSARYFAETAPGDHAETRYLLKIGIAVLFVSMVVEAIMLPRHFVPLALARLIIIFPLQLAALWCPVERLTLQKVLTALSLLIFGVLMMRASMWAPWPINAYMAMGPVSLFAVALPALPLRRQGVRLFAVAGLATISLALLLIDDPLPGRAIFLTIAALTTIFSLLIAERYCRLEERNFLLALIADEQLGSLADSNRRLEELSRLDPLTGLSNRRDARDSFAASYAAPPIDGEPRVTVMMLDIDHFKAFNDRWGHQVGDDCLVAAAELMRLCAESHGGLAARFGGEEFLILMRTRSPSQAIETAETLRRQIEEIDFGRGGAETATRCTASIGIAIHAGNASPDFAALMAQADDALYRAKDEGRNRSRLAP